MLKCHVLNSECLTSCLDRIRNYGPFTVNKAQCCPQVVASQVKLLIFQASDSPADICAC
jgi:hypothetical protein